METNLESVHKNIGMVLTTCLHTIYNRWQAVRQFTHATTDTAKLGMNPFMTIQGNAISLVKEKDRKTESLFSSKFTQKKLHY
jgi:hypothetical protein